MKIQNALVSNIFDRSQRYFAHVTTVLLSWRVQNIVVIGSVYFTLECFEFSSNFEFDRNMLSGTGAWSQGSSPHPNRYHLDGLRQGDILFSHHSMWHLNPPCTVSVVGVAAFRGVHRTREEPNDTHQHLGASGVITGRVGIYQHSWTFN